MLKAAVVILVSLISGSQYAASPNEVPPNQEFTLKVGEQALIQGTRIKIRFASVLEDTRCPDEVQCIWQGNAKVNLELKRAKRNLTSVIVNTGGEPREAEYRGFRVRLVKLSPTPKPGEVIDQGEYEATLIVLRL